MLPPRPTQSPAILVADALPIFRHGLLQVLSQAFAAHALCEAATAPEVLAVAQRWAPDVVVMAAGLPDAPADPGAVLAALRAQQPQVAVVVVIDPDTTPELVALRLLRQNVSALLLRTAPPQEVCETVRAVLAHGRCYNEYALNLLQSQLHHRQLPRPADCFSARQLEVLRLIADDHTNEEIAEYLCTSVRTVEYHRSQMLQKAGTRTTLGLVLFAQRQGLLSAPPPCSPLPDRQPVRQLAKS
ncbi:response regulator transcription factor [Hymenobacter negativus]|uniref:Response regulator transcription factor n=1 Tax=Hymenobacter negativus TaxID=2795026 RepID=A0ABS3QFG0_9BACT|nr:response regulator transcription factor [Hymenobacter negativus]MBO2009713.1 response regulator transcription factor [Hymenobacter negativus]